VTELFPATLEVADMTHGDHITAGMLALYTVSP
jgi:hypothetical protein